MRSDLIAQINTNHLLHNYQALRACCRPGVKLCVPLKADAYGHGVNIIAPTLHAAGADYAAVATLDEAVELRRLDWRRPILILGHVLAVGDHPERRERIEAIAEHRLTLTICDDQTVQHLTEDERSTIIDVHLKVDSGMGRMGVTPDRVVELAHQIQQVASLRLTGFYSHFATADFVIEDLVHKQLAIFNKALAETGGHLPPMAIRHMANSAATITLPEAHFDMVRPGLALFGYLPAPHMAKQIELKPILRLTSHLTLVKTLPAGHCVGYGKLFTTKRITRLGIVPVGYFDGFGRTLSNAAIVGTPAGDAPVVGRISMDQMAVDLTDLPPLAVGSQITLIDDRPGRPNSVAALADRLGTIPYEVTCLLGPRIERFAVQAPSGPVHKAAVVNN